MDGSDFILIFATLLFTLAMWLVNRALNDLNTAFYACLRARIVKFIPVVMPKKRFEHLIQKAEEAKALTEQVETQRMTIETMEGSMKEINEQLDALVERTEDGNGKWVN